MNEPISKRGFLRMLGAAGALAATAPLSACFVAAPVRTDWGHDYYFYPDVNVYFGLATGYYYYPVNRRWIRARRLPPHIHLRPAYRRRLLVRGLNPYRYNTQHRRRFPLHRQTRNVRVRPDRFGRPRRDPQRVRANRRQARAQQRLRRGQSRREHNRLRNEYRLRRGRR